MQVPKQGCIPMSPQCVKALVYYDIQSRRLDISNEKGDTALHIAARWGYQGIIETLLQNGAPTDVQNRLKETPLTCALNSKVAPPSVDPVGSLPPRVSGCVAAA